MAKNNMTFLAFKKLNEDNSLKENDKHSHFKDFKIIYFI